MIETQGFDRRASSFKNHSPGIKVLLVTPVQTGVQGDRREPGAPRLPFSRE